MNSFTIKPCGKSFVKRVKNFNYNKCDSAQKEQLKRLFRSTPVLIFENQHLNPKEHFDMCTWFDDNYTEDVMHPFESLAIPDVPQIAIRGKGYADVFGVKSPIGIADEFMYNPLWHMDVVGNVDKPPPIVSSMHMHITPGLRGQTMFASLENAFNNMSKDDKVQAMNTRVVYSTIHSFNAEYDYTGYGRLDKYWEHIFPEDDLKPWNMKVKDQFSTLPMIVFPNEDSTKPVLFISPNKVYNLKQGDKEYTPQESQEIVRYIMNKYVVTKENVYSVDFKEDDLVIFNNRKVIHTSTPTEEYTLDRIYSMLLLGTRDKLVEYN
jgi:alpha-ketoglutarate-dependent taurine dioxygenase